MDRAQLAGIAPFTEDHAIVRPTDDPGLRVRRQDSEEWAASEGVLEDIDRRDLPIGLLDVQISLVSG